MSHWTAWEFLPIKKKIDWYLNWRKYCNNLREIRINWELKKISNERAIGRESHHLYLYLSQVTIEINEWSEWKPAYSYESINLSKVWSATHYTCLFVLECNPVNCLLKEKHQHFVKQYNRIQIPYNPIFRLSKIQSSFIHMKSLENVIQSQEKKFKTDANPDVNRCWNY